MDPRYWTTLRVLVNKYCKGKEKEFLSALPKEHAEKIMQVAVTSDDLAPLIHLPEKCVNHYHYSWVNETINLKLPQELKKITISSLPDRQKIPLLKLNYKSQEEIQLSEPVKDFLVNHLSRHFAKKSLLPIEYLPPADLNFLLEMTKSQLCDLIDFLALYDLAQEVKRIVDRRVLQNINNTLNSPLKQQFLKVCMQRKEPASQNPLLKGWTGDPHKFHALVHTRGLQRLCYAIAGQNPSFVWQLSHILDIGRGKILLKYYSKKPIPKITSILVQQISQIMEFLNSKGVAK